MTNCAASSKHNGMEPLLPFLQLIAGDDSMWFLFNLIFPQLSGTTTLPLVTDNKLTMRTYMSAFFFFIYLLLLTVNQRMVIASTMHTHTSSRVATQACVLNKPRSTPLSALCWPLRTLPDSWSPALQLCGTFWQRSVSANMAASAQQAKTIHNDDAVLSIGQKCCQ